MRSIPHFAVTTLDGAPVAYASIWQRRSLVLVILRPADHSAAARYAADLTRALAGASDTALVVTTDAIEGITAPAAIVADRWGEVAHHTQASSAGDLPPPSELAAWVEHLRQRCPECEGESR